MLVNSADLINVSILSLQAGGAIAWTTTPIVDPDNLKILGFRLHGPLVDKAEANILDIKSVREYSKYGMVVDSIDEFVAPDDVIKIQKVLALNFNLVGLKVVTKKGANVGKVSGFTCTNNDFTIQQLVVHRPLLKSFSDSELLIPRSEIVEISDSKIVVKDDEKTIQKKAETTEFVPNYVNPFRKKPEPEYAPAQNQSPDEQDN